MEEPPMMTQAPDGIVRSASPDGACEAARAERHAAELRTLIDAGALTPDGRAAAHGSLALACAVLALRETITAAAAGAAGAVSGLDATLGIIAGAVTDTVTGDDDRTAALSLSTAGTAP
jgi:hypothetical protein